MTELLRKKMLQNRVGLCRTTAALYAIRLHATA